jgi:hypothetical protein
MHVYPSNSGSSSTPRTAVTRLSTTSISIGQLAWQTRQNVCFVVLAVAAIASLVDMRPPANVGGGAN